ncbi:MAG: alpha/beta hydrolase [Chloroflexi bacterium]|nr:alpha/beta hydrolase [Chloroflexota bacterium]
MLLKDPPVQFVTVDDIRLAYRESGSRTNPSMVLLHGLAETSAFFWRPLIARFQADYHIIAFDLLGHGDSDGPEKGYEIEAQATLVATAITKLGLSRSILVGHSLGGVIAARLTIDYPNLVHSLVLYDAPLSDTPPKNVLRFAQRVPLTALLLVLSVIFPRSMARLALGALPLRWAIKVALRRWRVPYRRERLNREFLDHAIRNSGIVLMECSRSAYLHHNLITDLPKLQTPTCMIVGDTDLLLPVRTAQKLSRLLPMGHLEIIKNAGHVALLDEPEQFNTALLRFLQNQEETYSAHVEVIDQYQEVIPQLQA